MAWSPVPNKASGDVFTEAMWDDYIKGNLNAIGDAWTSYTPTWTNLTVGTSSQEFKYLNAGKLYIVRFKITLASGFSISGAPEWTLPDSVSMNASYTGVSALGVAFVQKSGGSAWMAYISRGDSVASRARFAVLAVSSSNITFQSLSATSPTTWAANDVFSGQFMFEAA